jgi:hypothetical protein
MIRAALIHMGIGFLLGALLLQQKGIPVHAWMWKLLNPHIELMIFGWTIQLIMGTAYFILPRFALHRSRYGAESLGWWSFYLLNTGVSLTCLAYWFAVYGAALAGRLLILLSVLIYVIMIWPRVKPLTVSRTG